MQKNQMVDIGFTVLAHDTVADLAACVLKLQKQLKKYKSSEREYALVIYPDRVGLEKRSGGKYTRFISEDPKVIFTKLMNVFLKGT